MYLRRWRLQTVTQSTSAGSLSAIYWDWRQGFQWRWPTGRCYFCWDKYHTRPCIHKHHDPHRWEQFQQTWTQLQGYMLRELLWPKLHYILHTNGQCTGTLHLWPGWWDCLQSRIYKHLNKLCGMFTSRGMLWVYLHLLCCYSRQNPIQSVYTNLAVTCQLFS